MQVAVQEGEYVLAAGTGTRRCPVYLASFLGPGRGLPSVGEVIALLKPPAGILVQRTQLRARLNLFSLNPRFSGVIIRQKWGTGPE
jgi:hypothetical protein